MVWTKKKEAILSYFLAYLKEEKRILLIGEPHGREVAVTDDSVTLAKGQRIADDPEGRAAFEKSFRAFFHFAGFKALTEAEVCEVLDEDVRRVLGSDGPRLKESKARLHEEDHGAHDAQEEVVHV